MYRAAGFVSAASLYRMGETYIMRSVCIEPKMGKIISKLDLSGKEACLNLLLPEVDIRVESHLKRPAIVVLGGGGFDHVSLREGEPVALQFVAKGFVVGVLYYSLIPNRWPSQMHDVANAVAYLRKHAEEYYIDAERVFVLGLSAGGHPTAALAIYSSLEENTERLPEGARPNGIILGYPLLDTAEYGVEIATKNLLGEQMNNRELIEKTSLISLVHSKMPPVFIWSTQEDEIIPQQGILEFVSRLVKKGVRCEFHSYSKGVHGLGVATLQSAMSPAMIVPSSAEWVAAAIRWALDCSGKSNGMKSSR